MINMAKKISHKFLFSVIYLTLIQYTAILHTWKNKRNIIMMTL